MVTVEVGAGSVVIEDTWTGRAMFPSGIVRDVEKKKLLSSSRFTLSQALDVSLVFLLGSGTFSIYWCQELMAVILRARAEANQASFDAALAKAVDACLDSSVYALILDFRESSSLRYPLSTEELGLEDFGRYIVAVHPGYGAEPVHDNVHLLGFGTLNEATKWLRKSNQRRPARPDAIVTLGRTAGVKLVAANYTGCVYWWIRNRALILAFSGLESDDDSLVALLMAISDYLEHLRAAALIVDLRHLLSMHESRAQDISTAVKYLKSRGATLFIVVGIRRVQPGANDPLEAYMEILSHVSARVSVVKTVEQALELANNPQEQRRLDG